MIDVNGSEGATEFLNEVVHVWALGTTGNSPGDNGFCGGGVDQGDPGFTGTAGE